jgi:hypothetical protein
MAMKLSRWLAIAGGILVPLLETIRRWSTWRESPVSFFDDYILGGFLLFGAWSVGRDPRSGQKFLAAAWGFACGLGYASFFGQLESLRLGEPDPAPVPSECVAIIKGVLWGLAIAGLVMSLKRLPEGQK